MPITTAIPTLLPQVDDSISESGGLNEQQESQPLSDEALMRVKTSPRPLSQLILETCDLGEVEIARAAYTALENSQQINDVGYIKSLRAYFLMKSAPGVNLRGELAINASDIKYDSGDEIEGLEYAIKMIERRDSEKPNSVSSKIGDAIKRLFGPDSKELYEQISIIKRRELEALNDLHTRQHALDLEDVEKADMNPANLNGNENIYNGEELQGTSMKDLFEAISPIWNKVAPYVNGDIGALLGFPGVAKFGEINVPYDITSLIPTARSIYDYDRPINQYEFSGTVEHFSNMLFRIEETMKEGKEALEFKTPKIQQSYYDSQGRRMTAA